MWDTHCGHWVPFLFSITKCELNHIVQKVLDDPYDRNIICGQKSDRNSWFFSSGMDNTTFDSSGFLGNNLKNSFHLPSSPFPQAAFLGWLVCSFHLLVPQLSGHSHAHRGFSHRLDAWVGLGQLSLGWLGLAAKPTWISYNMYLPGFCST